MKDVSNLLVTGAALAVGVGAIVLHARRAAAATDSKTDKPAGDAPPPGDTPAPTGGDDSSSDTPTPLDLDAPIALAELLAFTQIDDGTIAQMQAQIVLMPGVTATAGLEAFRSELASMTEDDRSRYFEAAHSNDAVRLDAVADSFDGPGVLPAHRFSQSANQLLAMSAYVEAQGDLSETLVELVRRLAEEGVG